MKPVESAPVSPSLPPRLGGHVLIVDDDIDAREGVKDVLVDAGFEVDGVGHGAQALAYLRAHHGAAAPAAIVLDLFMPVMNGWQFVRQLQANPALARIPVVVVTAQEPHWGYPVPHVLRKPVDAEDLVRMVRQVVSAHRGIAA